jgi:ParB-like chromosome segregation protein Spo0J
MAAQAADRSEIVPIDSIIMAGSPRLSGENAEHTRMLREQLPDLPAIMVNRRTMQVIDGMHRLKAAQLEGASTIRVRFVDADERDAFLLAVKANTDHGLPLSLADRESAADRLLAWYPLWSDRTIASIVGLAATTVGAIRRRSSVQLPQLNARIGRDGRIRPMSTVEGRQRAKEIFEARPEASLREVAREAGISLGTVHNVRELIRRGEDCVRDRGTGSRLATSECEHKTTRRRRRSGEPVEWPGVRERLLKDPVLRYAEAGRALLRWFDLRAAGIGDWREVIDVIPPHWAETIIDLAHSCGNEWYELAGVIEQRREAEVERAAGE